MQEFIKQMEKEREANKTKGDWGKWEPHPLELFWEMQYHIGKLQKAVKDKDADKIREHSADVALYCQKFHSMSPFYGSVDEHN